MACEKIYISVHKYLFLKNNFRLRKYICVYVCTWPNLSKEEKLSCSFITLSLLMYFTNVSVWKGAYLRLTWRSALLPKSFCVNF